MGKLYKIKREILKNPSKWYSFYWAGNITYYGVYYRKGKIKPVHYDRKYKNYVRKVLKEHFLMEKLLELYNFSKDSS